MHALPARLSRHRYRAIIALCVFAPAVSSGCARSDLTDPDTASPEQPDRVGAALVAPSWPATIIASLPPAARPVWEACRAAGTLRPAGVPFVVGVNCRIIRVDGVDRRYVVHVPNHPNVTSGADVPLVVMYHGTAQDGEHFYEESAWQEEADANGFIFAFPSAATYRLLDGTLATKWNAYGLGEVIDSTWVPPALPVGAPWPLDDITFTNELLDDIEAGANIDVRREHVSGFSNGGSFVGRIAVELGSRIASAAAVTNPFPVAYLAATPIPFQYVLGNRDANAIDAINRNLLPGQASVVTVPMDPAMLFSHFDPDTRRINMANTFQLDPAAWTSTQSLTATGMVWQTPQAGNLTGNEVEWWIIRGMEHEYARGPGRRYPPNNPGGFDAPHLFWSWFATHTK